MTAIPWTQPLPVPEGPGELDETPIAGFVDALQSEGRNVYISGWRDDGKYALIVDVDNAQVSVASRHTCSGLGRWECSKQHHEHHADLYRQRFPRR